MSKLLLLKISFLTMVFSICLNADCENGATVSMQEFLKNTHSQNSHVFYELLPNSQGVRWIVVMGDNGYNSCQAYEHGNNAMLRLDSYLNERAQFYVHNDLALYTYLGTIKNIEQKTYESILKSKDNSARLHFLLKNSLIQTSSISFYPTLENSGAFVKGSGKNILYK